MDKESKQLKTRKEKLAFITKMLDVIKNYQTTFHGKDLALLPDHELDKIVTEIMQLQELQKTADMRAFQYIPKLKQIFKKADVLISIKKIQQDYNAKPVYVAKPGQPLHGEKRQKAVKLLGILNEYFDKHPFTPKNK
jgi:hypothetical protein